MMNSSYKALFFSAFLFCGASAQGQDNAEPLDPIVIHYDAKADADSIQRLGETMPTFLSWFEQKDGNFCGDTDTYCLEIGSFSNRTPALSHSSRGYAYQSPRVKRYGPSYNGCAIVWFTNGFFDEITHCTGKVRFHDSIDTYRHVGYGISANLDKVISVEIVGGDTNFRDRIPHLKSWKGQPPVLIYVTYEGNSYLR